MIFHFVAHNLNSVNLHDDGDRVRDSYFRLGFSKLDRHVRCLRSSGTKSLLLKLKVKSLKHMCFLDITLS